MPTRRLTLRRETLAALSTDELAVVAGAAAGPTGPEPTPPVYAPRTLRLEDCFAISVALNCGDITYQPRCF